MTAHVFRSSFCAHGSTTPLVVLEVKSLDLAGIGVQIGSYWAVKAKNPSTGVGEWYVGLHPKSLRLLPPPPYEVYLPTYECNTLSLFKGRGPTGASIVLVVAWWHPVSADLYMESAPALVIYPLPTATHLTDINTAQLFQSTEFGVYVGNISFRNRGVTYHADYIGFMGDRTQLLSVHGPHFGWVDIDVSRIGLPYIPLHRVRAITQEYNTPSHMSFPALVPAFNNRGTSKQIPARIKAWGIPRTNKTSTYPRMGGLNVVAALYGDGVSDPLGVANYYKLVATSANKVVDANSGEHSIVRFNHAIFGNDQGFTYGRAARQESDNLNDFSVVQEKLSAIPSGGLRGITFGISLHEYFTDETARGLSLADGRLVGHIQALVYTPSAIHHCNVSNSYPELNAVTWGAPTDSIISIACGYKGSFTDPRTLFGATKHLSNTGIAVLCYGKVYFARTASDLATPTLVYSIPGVVENSKVSFAGDITFVPEGSAVGLPSGWYAVMVATTENAGSFDNVIHVVYSADGTTWTLQNSVGLKSVLDSYGATDWTHESDWRFNIQLCGRGWLILAGCPCTVGGSDGFVEGGFYTRHTSSTEATLAPLNSSTARRSFFGTPLDCDGSDYPVVITKNYSVNRFQCSFVDAGHVNYTETLYLQGSADITNPYDHPLTRAFGGFSNNYTVLMTLGYDTEAPLLHNLVALKTSVGNTRGCVALQPSYDLTDVLLLPTIETAYGGDGGSSILSPSGISGFTIDYTTAKGFSTPELGSLLFVRGGPDPAGPITHLITSSDYLGTYSGLGGSGVGAVAPLCDICSIGGTVGFSDVAARRVGDNPPEIILVDTTGRLYRMKTDFSGDEPTWTPYYSLPDYALHSMLTFEDQMGEPTLNLTSGTGTTSYWKNGVVEAPTMVPSAFVGGSNPKALSTKYMGTSGAEITGTLVPGTDNYKTLIIDFCFSYTPSGNEHETLLALTAGSSRYMEVFVESGVLKLLVQNLAFNMTYTLPYSPTANGFADGSPHQLRIMFMADQIVVVLDGNWSRFSGYDNDFSSCTSSFTYLGNYSQSPVVKAELMCAPSLYGASNHAQGTVEWFYLGTSSADFFTYIDWTTSSMYFRMNLHAQKPTVNGYFYRRVVNLYFDLVVMAEGTIFRPKTLCWSGDVWVSVGTLGSSNTQVLGYSTDLAEWHILPLEAQLPWEPIYSLQDSGYSDSLIGLIKDTDSPLGTITDVSM